MDLMSEPSQMVSLSASESGDEFFSLGVSQHSSRPTLDFVGNNAENSTNKRFVNERHDLRQVVTCF